MPASTPKLNLYLHTYSLRFNLTLNPSYDVFSFIDQAAAENFDGVCISANDPNYRHLGGTESWRFAPIRERIKHHNLLCDMDTSGTEPDHLTIMLQVAKSIGASKLRTYTRYAGTPDDLVSQTIKDFKVLAPIAEDMGIKVMFENHEVFTGPEIVRVLEGVNSPFIGALYDYGNSQMVLEDPLECLKSMAPFSYSAHLKDHVMIRPEDSPDGELSVLGVPVGDGFLPIMETTRSLLEAGCNNIVFENSYGYRAKVKAERMNPESLKLLGKTSFQLAQNPHSNNEAYLLYPEQFSAERLIELENAMHQRTLTWLRSEFAKEGWL